MRHCSFDVSVSPSPERFGRLKQTAFFNHRANECPVEKFLTSYNGNTMLTVL